MYHCLIKREGESNISRPTVEALQARGDYLSGNEMQRLGLLTNAGNVLCPGKGIWRWPQATKIEACAQCLSVHYISGRRGSIPILWKRAGIVLRPYLICEFCSKPRGKLYAGLGTYGCRRCIGARYSIELLNNQKRVRRKQQRLLAELGVHHNVGGVIRRPSGMWRRRFRRIRNEYEQAQSKLCPHGRYSKTSHKITWRITQ